MKLVGAAVRAWLEADDMPGSLSPEIRQLIGIVTTAELLATGTTANQIRGMVSSGTLIPVFRGVYMRAEQASKFSDLPGGKHLLEAAAAVAVIGNSAVVSHQSAAQLYGIDLLHKPGPQVTLTSRERDWKNRPGIHVYAVDLPDSHRTVASGLPMTTAARTVVDLARTLDFKAGVVAADSALRRKITSKPELESALAAQSNWRGVRQAAEVVAFADKRAESPLESISRVVFRDVGLPPPDLQVWLGGKVEPVGRVDFYWKKYRTVAEVDGALKYDDPTRARLQLKRDALLRADEFEVVHFDWQDITKAPDYVAEQMWRAFRRGASTAAKRKTAM